MIPFEKLEPSASVAHLVDHYRIRDLARGTPPVPVLARAAHAIQFYLDAPYEAVDSHTGVRSTAPEVTLVGARTECRETIAARGPMRIVSVQLRPGALHRLTGVSAAEIVNASPDANLLFGGMLRDTLARLRETDLARASGVLDAFFAGRSVHDAHVADRIASQLVLHPSLSIESLAGLGGFSRRQLERAFVARIGIGPKRFARIARFERAHGLRRRTGASWTSIAQMCGYSDQAHLIRDFREFAGTAPGNGVAFVQSAGRAGALSSST